MSDNFTLNDLADFYRKEKTILDNLFNTKKMEFSPKASTIKNILAYSKVVSVRDTKLMGHVDFVLN